MKKGISTDTLTMINGMRDKTKASKGKTRERFKKPSGDYYRLDLVVRDTAKGENGRAVMLEDIKTDYRAYIDSVRGTDSITAYIHKLLDNDMKKHNKANK